MRGESGANASSEFLIVQREEHGRRFSKGYDAGRKSRVSSAILQWTTTPLRCR